MTLVTCCLKVLLENFKVGEFKLKLESSNQSF